MVRALRDALMSDEARAVLLARVAGMRTQQNFGPTGGAILRDLAAALEMAEPDRMYAFEAYLTAWRCERDDLGSLRRARVLSLELAELTTAAKISRLEYQATRSPELLVQEGIAWIDAGHQARAIAPLKAAASALPEREEVALLLKLAQGELQNARELSAELSKRAEKAPPEQGAADFMLAARIARIAVGDQEAYGRFLARSFSCHPHDDEVLTLLEDWLLSRGKTEYLLRAYEHRALSCTPPAVSDLYRRAGTSLLRRKQSPGLAVRLLTTGLQRGYKASVSPIPGHLASLTLLREFAAKARLGEQLLSLIATGLQSELTEDEQLGLALHGLEIAWEELHDSDLSLPYASAIARLAPEHAALARYYSLGGLKHSPEFVTGQDEGAGEEEMVYLDSVSHTSSSSHEMPAKIGLAAAEFVTGQEAADDDRGHEEDEEPSLTTGDTIRDPLPELPESEEILDPEEAGMEVVDADDLGMELIDEESEESAPARPVVSPLTLMEPAPTPTPTLEAVESELDDEFGEPAHHAHPILAQGHAAPAGAVAPLAASTVSQEPVTPQLAGDGALATAAPEPSPTPPPAVDSTLQSNTAAPGETPASEELAAGTLPGTELELAPEPEPEPELEPEPEPEPVAEPEPKPKAKAVSPLIPASAMSALRSVRAKPKPVPLPVPPTDTKRSAPRIACPADVWIRPGDEAIAAVTRDISATGLFLVTEVDLDIGSEIRLSIMLPAVKSWKEETENVTGKVIRRSEFGYGIEFVSPPESLIARLGELTQNKG